MLQLMESGGIGHWVRQDRVSGCSIFYLCLPWLLLPGGLPRSHVTVMHRLRLYCACGRDGGRPYRAQPCTPLFRPAVSDPENAISVRPVLRHRLPRAGCAVPIERPAQDGLSPCGSGCGLWAGQHACLLTGHGAAD